VKLANDILKVSSGFASPALILRVGCDAFSGIDQKAILPEIIQDDPFPRFQISTTFLRDRVRNEDPGINLLWNQSSFEQFDPRYQFALHESPPLSPRSRNQARSKSPRAVSRAP
jgi:hypothetical protein